MKTDKRKIIWKACALSLAGTLAVYLPAPGTAENRTAFAEELILEEGDGQEAIVDSIPEEPEFPEQPTVPETVAGDDGSSDASAELIEDEGGQSVSVQEGDSFEEVIREEEEALARELAAQKMQELLLKEVWMPENASTETLFSYYAALTNEESPIGSDGELILSRYIKEIMESMGYSAEEQYFHEGFLNENMMDMQGINIIAERGANSEERSRKILLLCAHYDSKTDPQDGDPAANDKTGAAILLETARLLKDAESDLDLCFLFLSGEEDGGYGAREFVKMLDEDLKERICGVIYVGRAGYVYRDMVEGENSDRVTDATEDSTESTTVNGSDHPAYLLATKDGEETVSARVLQTFGQVREQAVLNYTGLFDMEENTLEETEAPDDMASEAENAEQIANGSVNETIGTAAGENMDDAEAVEDWTIGLLLNGGGTYLQELCADVTVMTQLIEGDEVAAPPITTEEEGEETLTEESAEQAAEETEEKSTEEMTENLTEDTTESETENTDETVKARELILDMPTLASCADVLARLTALYMQSADMAQ